LIEHRQPRAFVGFGKYHVEADDDNAVFVE